MLDSAHSSEQPRQPCSHGQTATGDLNCRVLLVEDTPDHQRLYLRFLTHAGADVTLECNGQAAVERVMRSSNIEPAFDVIVMDIRMPVLDGIAATKKLREQGCQIPVIALTAEDNSDTRQKCDDAGCTRFMTKLTHPAQLVETVRDLSRHCVEK